MPVWRTCCRNRLLEPKHTCLCPASSGPSRSRRGLIQAASAGARRPGSAPIYLLWRQWPSLARTCPANCRPEDDRQAAWRKAHCHAYSTWRLFTIVLFPYGEHPGSTAIIIPFAHGITRREDHSRAAAIRYFGRKPYECQRTYNASSGDAVAIPATGRRACGSMAFRLVPWRKR